MFSLLLRLLIPSASFPRQQNPGFLQYIHDNYAVMCYNNRVYQLDFSDNQEYLEDE